VDLRVLLGVPVGSEPSITVMRRVPSREIDVEAIEVSSAPNVWVPNWLFMPRGRANNKPLVLILEASGRNYRWHDGALYQTLAARGYPVCAADVRGVGDLAPEFGAGDPGYARSHQHEENYAWASLILGRPLLGQRVADILAVVAGLRKHPAADGRRLVVAARGKMTVPAIFAAALDANISELYLAGGLISYRSIVETENYDHSFGNFVPGMLRHTDLPEVVQSLAPRPVTLAGSVDAGGSTMARAAVRRVHAGEHVTVLDRGGWGIDALSSWKA